MITRVALYARYSSDQQREASIEDQLRLCREHAAREGWTIAGSYQDAGISGASLVLRPGIQRLVRDAQGGSFEIVLAEALDRISRDQADIATLYKQLKFCGVAIVTLAEGTICELHVGLNGTMNALFLKDLALKTQRGLRGRVEAGKSGGGLCYGYRVVKKLDANGEASRGGREIVPQKAEVIRRIFRDFAAGVGPRAIAKSLKEQGIAGPAGRLWNDTTIRGHVRRGTGIVNNELCIGKLVWNRQRYVKDPATGGRVSRLNPPEQWIVAQVPELRIVDDQLWHAVKARQDEIADSHVKLTGAIRAHPQRSRLAGARRPKSLLSGLVVCGCCGGAYSLRSVDRFACSSHISNDACDNRRTISRRELEQQVLAGLKEWMMAGGRGGGAGQRCLISACLASTFGGAGAVPVATVRYGFRLLPVFARPDHKGLERAPGVCPALPDSKGRPMGVSHTTQWDSIMAAISPPEAPRFRIRCVLDP